jgi:hypothetical protein
MDKQERKKIAKDAKIADYIAIQFSVGMNSYWEWAFQQLVNLGIVVKCNDDYDTWIGNL